jgi:hypothetical protein
VPEIVEPWRKYQEQVADLLSQLGFAVAIDKQVEGARGTHQIDVTATRSGHGIQQLWVIECKLWKHPVPKKDVLTLAGVVADIGADRGLLFSESGFQAGAIKVARSTNLSLTSIVEFRQKVADELTQQRIRSLDKRAADLIHAMENAWHCADDTRDDTRLRYLGPSGFVGPIEAVAGTTSVLSMLRQSLEYAEYGKWPVPFTPLDHDDHDGAITVGHWDGLLFVADETIATCEHIYSYMIDGGDSVASWKDLQSREMTELLAQIRAR